MALKRGFKTGANSVALEVRSELGLGVRDALDPWKLADHLAIPVLPLSTLAVDHQRLKYFLEAEPNAFSAATVFDGSRRTIVHNDAHSAARQASDLAHELSHGILLHAPSAALDDRGCRAWNEDIEDEATWLSGCLLIPAPAALWVARRGMDLDEAADRFGVSTAMVRYRMNVTGAHVRLQRAQGRSY